MNNRWKCRIAVGIAILGWVGAGPVSDAACDPGSLLIGDASHWQHKSTPEIARFVYRGTSVPGRIMRIQVSLQAHETYVFSLCAADGGSTYGAGGDAVLHLCGSTNAVPSGLLARGDNECGTGPRLTYVAPVSGPVWVVVSAKDCESFGDGAFALVYWRDSCVKEIQKASDTSVVAITDAAGYGGTGTLVARDTGSFVPYVLSCDSRHSGAWNWGESKVKITFHDGTVRWAEHVANEGFLGLWRLQSGFPFRHDYSRYTFAGWKRRLGPTEPSIVRHYTRVRNNPGNPVAQQYGGSGVLGGSGTTAAYDGPLEGEWFGTGASGASHREPGTGRVMAVTQTFGGEGNSSTDCEQNVRLQDRAGTVPLAEAFTNRRQLGRGDSAGRKGGLY